MPSTRSILFAEDFDVANPVPAPEPEIIAPVFTADDLEQARADAWQEGHDAGQAEAAVEAERGAQETATRIAAQIEAARMELQRMAQESADTIARLLLESFAAAFPGLCAAYAENEITALIRAVLPALSQEPSIIVRACPLVLEAAAREIERLDPDLVERVRLVPAAMPPGDIRMNWHAGSAVRDTGSLWSEIVEILAPAGFLTATAPGKELANVE